MAKRKKTTRPLPAADIGYSDLLGDLSGLLDQARAFARRLGGEKFVTTLRPLSALAALAIRDCRRGEPFEAEGTPGRAAAMLRHRFSGRLPRA